MSGSVYERRRLGWLDRLRVRLGAPDPRGREILYNRHGEPTYVIVRGHVAGVRATDGTLIRFPELPLEELPESEWATIFGPRGFGP